MANKTITITEEQLAVAIADACENFDMAMNAVDDCFSSTRAAMMLQNMMFGLEIKKVLFETKDENKGEE